MFGISIDWTISVGNLLTMISMAGAVGYMFVRVRDNVNLLRYDVVGLKEKQEALSEAFVQIGRILTQVAVQDTRMSMLEKQLDDLRHGHGFVNYNNLNKRMNKDAE